MPTYDYTCESCGHTLEVRQPITDAPLKSCPECKKEALVRGVGGGSASFRFMGSGFYITDYKKEGSSTASSSSSSSCGCGSAHTCSTKKEKSQ